MILCKKCGKQIEYDATQRTNYNEHLSVVSYAKTVEGKITLVAKKFITRQVEGCFFYETVNFPQYDNEILCVNCRVPTQADLTALQLQDHY